MPSTSDASTGPCLRGSGYVLSLVAVYSLFNVIDFCSPTVSFLVWRQHTIPTLTVGREDCTRLSSHRRRGEPTASLRHHSALWADVDDIPAIDNVRSGASMEGGESSSTHRRRSS